MEKLVVHISADIEDLIPAFIKNRRNDIAAIALAADQNDFQSIQVRGHDMKGAGGGYGFDEISQIGALIEGAAARKDREEIKRQISMLSAYLDRVHLVFDKEK